MAQRLLAAAAGFIAVLVLAACGSGSTDTRSASATSSPAQTTSRSIAQTTEPAAREIDGLRGFISPTGNVACMIAADWARCDIIDRDWSPPPRPAGCEFDYGQGISVAPGERAQFVCAGDTAFGPDAILPYGESISAGALRCESTEDGITCRDLRTAHGFSISREAYQLF
jgi:hypothetical protein